MAQSVGAAQFYLSCGQITITGGGSGTPSPLVAFPGAYSATDPGILIDIYYPVVCLFCYSIWEICTLMEKQPKSYTFPGPAVWTGWCGKMRWWLMRQTRLEGSDLGVVCIEFWGGRWVVSRLVAEVLCIYPSLAAFNYTYIYQVPSQREFSIRVIAQMICSVGMWGKSTQYHHQDTVVSRLTAGLTLPSN